LLCSRVLPSGRVGTSTATEAIRLRPYHQREESGKGAKRLIEAAIVGETREQRAREKISLS
jgi:hypothetical protein